MTDELKGLAGEEYGGQSELARAIGVPRQRLNDWLTGRRTPDLAAWLKIQAFREEKQKDGRQTKMNTRHRFCRGIVLSFGLIAWLSGNVLAQKNPFLVLDIYAKAATAVEQDPLVPIEQDLAKGREPKIPQGFSHLITETFPLKPDPQPFGVLDETIEDQLINLSFIAAASGDGQWILSAYRGDIRDKNSEEIETPSDYDVKDPTVRRADQKVFHTLKSPIKGNGREAEVVYVLVFSLQRGEED